MRRAARSALVAVAGTAIATAGCGLHGARVALPAGAGEARADYATEFAAATATCRPIHKLTADLALSGNAGRQRLGGHVLAGVAPDARRLEGVAPFGGPIFILAAENGKGTLLLPRERHAVESGPPSEILEALVGVGLSPDDLLAVLTGCVKASAAPVSGRMYGADCLAIDLNGGVS